ncbi:hypothetical protein [Persephonella sp.]
MFIEVRENVFVNLEQVKEIRFIEEDKTPYSDKENYWVFVLGYASPTDYWNGEYAIETKQFGTKEEALKWFEEKIKPALEEYRKSKLLAPQDIAEFIEGINYDTSVIREFFEKERA